MAIKYLSIKAALKKLMKQMKSCLKTNITHAYIFNIRCIVKNCGIWKYAMPLSHLTKDLLALRTYQWV